VIFLERNIVVFLLGEHQSSQKSRSYLKNYKQNLFAVAI
jgi:hypothetical protein